MVTVYGPKETSFTHNGYGVVTAKEAKVTEELNGMFELELLCPAVDTNKKIMPYFNETYILKADTPRGKQLFRIYSVKKNLAMEIKINARHITYDLAFAMIENLSDILTASAAMQRVVNNAASYLNFTGTTNINKTSEFDFINTNPINAILGEFGLAEVFGGELLRDNLSLSLRTALGQDRGFFVRYRKNLTGLDVEANFDNVVTKIKPVGLNAEGEPLYLPINPFVNSLRINDYFTPIVRPMELRNIRAGTEEFPTEEDVFDAMIAEVNAFYENGGDLPNTNAKVNFVLLRDTAEYAEYAALENIALGDTVTAVYEPLGFNMKAKCIKYAYDCILGRYINIELGDFRNNFATAVGGEVTRLQGASSQVPQLTKIWEILSSHAHTGTDGTPRVDYNNLLNRPN